MIFHNDSNFQILVKGIVLYFAINISLKCILSEYDNYSDTLIEDGYMYHFKADRPEKIHLAVCRR